MKNLLLFAAIFFTISNCSNPVSDGGDNMPGAGDTVGETTQGYTIIEGTFGEIKPDTLRFEAGRYRTHLFYLDCVNEADFWEMRNGIVVNYTDGKIVFKEWSPGLKYRVMLFE